MSLLPASVLTSGAGFKGGGLCAGGSRLPAFGVVTQMKKSQVTKTSVGLETAGNFVLFSEIWCGISIFLLPLLSEVAA